MKKLLKPLSKELKEIKDTIRCIKDNRGYVKAQTAREEQEIDEKIAQLDPNNWFDGLIIDRLQKEKSEVFGKVCERQSNDATIMIVYDNGTYIYVTDAEILAGDITPKMQHIVYASYSDGYVEYDTYIGLLVNWNVNYFGDLSTDEGIQNRQDYYEKIDNIFNVNRNQK